MEENGASDGQKRLAGRQRRCSRRRQTPGEGADEGALADRNEMKSKQKLIWLTAQLIMNTHRGNLLRIDGVCVGVLGELLSWLVVRAI